MFDRHNFPKGTVNESTITLLDADICPLNHCINFDPHLRIYRDKYTELTQLTFQFSFENEH